MKYITSYKNYIKEWTSWRDDLYEPNETWSDRSSELKKLLTNNTKKRKYKKIHKAMPPDYTSNVMVSPDWEEVEEIELKERVVTEDLDDNFEFIEDWEDEEQLYTKMRKVSHHTDPDPKDMMRIDDIIKKSSGDRHTMIKLTNTMCKLIKDPNKALRRGLAAEVLSRQSGIERRVRPEYLIEIARIFYRKYDELR